MPNIKIANMQVQHQLNNIAFYIQLELTRIFIFLKNKE